MEQSGLVLDNIFNPKANSWINGRNMVIPKGTSSFQNEHGFQSQGLVPLPVIGFIETPIETVLFIGNDVVSEIGVYNNGVYTPKFREPLLNFKRYYPITGTYIYNHLGNLIVAWTDGYNSPKLLNLGELPFKSLLNSDLALNNKEEFTLCELFPTINTSDVEITNITSGGTLKSGVYYILVSYGYEDGSTTSWFNISNPISIYEANNATGFNQICGSEAGKTTDKAIAVKLLNLDRNFSYVNIAVVSVIGGVTSAVQLQPIPIVNYTVGTNILNLQSGTPISLTELLVNNPVYEKISSLENHDGALLAGNTVGLPKLDIQEHINKIQIKWYRDKPISLDGYKGSYKDPIYISKYKSFRAGEVYGFLAAARLKKGGYYGIYHIPGRAPAGDDKLLLDGVSYPNDSQLDTLVYKFQTRSTAQSDGTMGYWENRNELYPQTFPVDGNGNELANTPVRHHKFPTLAQLQSWNKPFITDTLINSGADTLLLAKENQSIHNYGNWNVLGYGTVPISDKGVFTEQGRTYTALSDQTININLDSTLYPSANVLPEYAISIKVYTNNNILKTIIWQGTGTGNIGQTLDVDTIKSVSLLQGERVVFEYLFFGGENQDDSCDILADITYDISSNYYSVEGTSFGYPLGIIISNINIPENIKKYIDAIEIFYYERTADNMTILDQSILYNQTWKEITNIYDVGRFHGFDIHTILSSIKATHLTGELLFEKESSFTVTTSRDYTNSNYLIGEATEYGMPGLLRRINKTTFAPANNSATDPNNSSRENCLLVNFNTGIVTQHRMLVNLCSYKTDVYNTMFAQRVISTGYIIKLSENTVDTEYTVFGGDTFISPFGFGIWVSPNPNDPQVEIDTYHRLKIIVPVESSANIGLRFDTMIPHEKFYPKTDVYANNYFKDNLINEYGNFYGYNSDYNALNNLKAFVIFNPSNKYIKDFKYRIARSLPQTRETTALKWRIFPATLYYDMPMNKGEITGIKSHGVIVFIFHRFAAYKAMVKDLLQLFNTDAYLSAGDIFDRPPVEIYPSKNGYVGYQSKFAILPTEYGIVVVDRIRGKIFLLADDLKELTTPDVEEKIKEYLTLDKQEYILYPLLADATTYIESELGKPIIYADPTEKLEVIDNIDNPGIDKGVHLYYDKKYKRVLMTVLNKVNHYNINTPSIGEVKPAYCTFICTELGTLDDIDKTISVTLAGTTVSIVAKQFSTQPEQFAINFRIPQTNNMYNAFVNVIAAAGLNDRFSVNKHDSVVIISANEANGTDTITDPTSNVTNVFLGENVPYRTIEDKSVTLSVSLERMFWLFKHDYIPNFAFNRLEDVFLIQNQLVYAYSFIMHNKTSFGMYFDKTVYPAFLDMAINLKSTQADVFVDNIMVMATVRDMVKNANLYDKSITHFAIYTQNQCTGLIPIQTLGYINENSNASFNDRNLIIYKYRDQVLDHNEAFIDEKGNFILTNLANQRVTSVVANHKYLITGIIDPNNDYVIYDGVTYKYNGEVITIKPDNTTIQIFGNAILKTYKTWDNFSYIAGKLIIVRLYYNNAEQHSFELNGVLVNDNKKNKR